MAKEYSGVKLDVTFTKASTRENIISAENIALSFGKLAKWYTDFAWSAWTAPTVEVTGSGNAITSASYGTGANANKLILTKGSTFLTQHPTIPTQTDTTSTASPAFGGTFTAVDSVTRDSNGHVLKINTKTITVPNKTMGAATADTAGTIGLVPAPGAGKQASFLRGDGTWVVPTNTDTKVTQNVSSADKNYPVLLSYYENTDNTTTAQTVNRVDTIYANPRSGYLWAKALQSTTWEVAPTSSVPSNASFTLNDTGLYFRSRYLSEDGNAYDYSRPVLRTYKGKHNNNGMVVSLDSGGLTIVGGGESATSLAGLISDDQHSTSTTPTTLNVGGTLNTAFNGSAEQLILSSDSNIYFLANCGAVANRKPVCLDTSLYFYPGTNETGSIGTSSYKWGNGYFKTINIGTANITTGNITTLNATKSNGIAKVGYVAFPEDGTLLYNEGGSSVTGAIVITTPFSKTVHSVMLKFTVDIYDYQSNKSIEYKVAGYAYTDGKWYCVTAHNVAAPLYGQQGTDSSETGYEDLAVRFGYVTNGNYQIQIGETTTVWKWPNIVIRDILVGHVRATEADIPNVKSGWSIAIQSSGDIANVTQTISHTRPYYPTTTVSGSVDADTYLKYDGIIRWNTTTGTNMPTTNYGLLICKAGPAVQVFIPDNASGMYFRRKASTSGATPTAWWGFTGTAGNTYNLDNFITSYTDEKVKITTLAASTAAATYMPTFVAAAGTSGVNVMSAIKYGHNPGTTSAVGNSRLILGNAAAEGSANNEQGLLRIYSAGTAYHTLYGMKTNTNIEHALPTVGGTLINSGCVGTGLTWDSTNNALKHSNSVTAVSTAALLKVKYDSQGHITGSTAAAKADIPGLSDYLPLAGGTMDTNAEIIIPNGDNASKLTWGSMNFKVGISGAWARGFNFYSDDFSTQIGSLGVYGAKNATVPELMYFGKAYNDRWHTWYKNKYVITDDGSTLFDFQYQPANLDSGYTGSFIQLKAAAQYGYGIIIGRRHGGTTMIGAGESANGLCNVIENSLNPWGSSALDYGAENLYNISDTSIYFISGANGLSTSAYTDWTDIKTALFDNTGYFRPSKDKKGQIGASNYRWNVGYFETVNANTYQGITEGSVGFDGTESFANNAIPPVNVPLVNTYRANKFAFMKAANIAIEYSTDSGSTWTDAGYTNAQKQNIFVMRHAADIKIGPNTSADRTATMQTRITLTFDDRDATINKFFIWYQTNGHVSVLDIKYSTQSAKTTFVDYRTGVTMTGWSGGNIVNGAGIRLKNTIYQIQLIFRYTGIHASYKTTPSRIYDIQAFGREGFWTAANNMMGYDHLYGWDASQNAKFPAEVQSNTQTRIRSTDYGVILRNDNSYFWMLLTDSGSPEGAYNSLRPFKMGLTDGKITIANTAFAPLTIQRSSAATGAVIQFVNSNGTLGYIGMTGTADGGLMRWSASGTLYTVCDTGNTSVTQVLSSGTKIATIKIAGTSTDLYCEKNTNTDTKVNVTLGTTTKAYLLGTSTTPTSTATAVTSIADTGVYLTTTAGELQATTFKGDLNGTINTATTATTQTKGNSSTKVATTAFVQTAIGDYIPLAGSSAISGDLKMNVTNKGFWLVDTAGNSYPGMKDNNANLWIGAADSNSPHHVGNVYIAAGYNSASSKGNLSINIYAPNAANTKGAATWTVYHTGNLLVGTGLTIGSAASTTYNGTVWTINHSNSITAGTAKGDDSKTLTFGGTFTIPSITYDTQGHITAKGTTTMTMPADPNKCAFVVDETSDFASYAWHKFAEVTLSDAYADAIVTFLVSKTWGQLTRETGILTAHIRTGSTKVFESAQFNWLVAGDTINPAEFVMVYTNTASTSCKVELWHKQTVRYDGWIFKVLKEHSRSSYGANPWTLFVHSGHGSATYTTGTGTIVSSLNTIANTAVSADKINTDAGSNVTPVYFSSGIPVAVNKPASGAWFSTVPSVGSTGVIDIGRYIDFHSTNAGTTDYDVRLDCSSTSLLTLSSNSGTPALRIAGTLPKLRFTQTTTGKEYDNAGVGIWCQPADRSGVNMFMQSHGNMMISSGEFCSNAYARKDATGQTQVGYDNIVGSATEKLYLGADGEVQIISNGQNIATYSNNNHKVWKFGTDGTLLDPKGLVVTGMDKNSTSYWGMFDGDGVSNNWIRTTTYGFIPYQSGGLTSPHSALGTSTWSFSDVWSQKIHGVNLDVYNSAATYKHTITSIASANRTVTLPDTNCTVGTGFFYVLGTQNAKTKMWTGNLPIPQLYDGLTIAFYLPYDVVTSQNSTVWDASSNTNVWLQLTLSNGQTTDWVPCYWTNQSRITTHFSSGATVLLTYWSTPKINGANAAAPVSKQEGGQTVYWPSIARWTRADYNSNSDTKVNVTLGKTTKAYLLGTSTTPTSTAAAVTTIADTGVYLDTTAGMITATTFNGAATKLSTNAGTEVDPVYFTNGVPTVCKKPNVSVSGHSYASSTPYFKLAETADITSAKTSYRICFLVSKRKIADSTTNASYGIMCVHFESSTSNGTFGYGSVKWLAVENGLDTSSISVKYTTGTNKFSVAIWAKLSSTNDLIIMRSIDNHGFSYESNTAVWSFISNTTAAASASGTEIPVTISLLQNTIGGGQSLLYNGSVNLGSTSTSSPAQLTISGNYPLADYQALLIEFWSPGSGNSNRIVVPLRYVRSQTAGTIVWFQLLPTAQSSDATSTNHNNCIGISSNSGGSSYTKKVLVVSGGNITGTWLIRVYSLS